VTTNFTAAQLVEMAVQDPTDIVGITDNASEYWFADAGGAGFFTVNGVVQPQGVWIAVPSSQLNSVIFTQADSIADFVDVTDENPAFSGFLYFPMVLSPSTVPPAPPPVIGITPLDADKDNARSGSVPFTFTVTRSGNSNATITATWTVSATGNPPAVSADFVGGRFPSGIVTLGPNQTSAVVTVNVQGTTAVEPTQNFVVTLSKPNGATIDPQHPSALGVILNNNQPTADMILRDGANGKYEIYSIADNAIVTAAGLGQVGTEWTAAGLGDFSGNAGELSDMLLRNSRTGQFEVYDISNNQLVSAAPMGQVGLEWAVVGFGDFSSIPNETDMLMRNLNTGAFEVYDISQNRITAAMPMGQVGLEWSVAGFGDFSGNANETDMLMRNNNTGAFELYDISQNRITAAMPMGQVGLEWAIAGFGDFSGNTNETDMLMRNRKTGAFEVYDISNNRITFAAPMGQVGTEWSVAGFGDFSGNANETDMLMRNGNTGAFEVYDIVHNQIATAEPMGQVGTEWSVVGAANTGVAASSASAAQFVQALASTSPGNAALEIAPSPVAAIALTPAVPLLAPGGSSPLA
jgi:hypothetical protein